METTQEQLEKLIANSKKEFKEFTFIEALKVDYHLPGITYFIADLNKNVSKGYLDENGEYVNALSEDDDTYINQISWWDGSNTKEVYAHEDECIYKALAYIGSETVKSSGTYQEYESFLIDENGLVYIDYSDNTKPSPLMLIEVSK
jgi:flagellar hook assembly protein FlgD